MQFFLLHQEHQSPLPILTTLIPCLDHPFAKIYKNKIKSAIDNIKFTSGSASITDDENTIKDSLLFFKGFGRVPDTVNNLIDDLIKELPGRSGLINNLKDYINSIV